MERRPFASQWIGAGLWAGLVLASVRALVVFGMDHIVRGHDLAMTTWRVAERVPTSLAWSGLIGLACAWLLRRRARSRLGRAAVVCACAGMVLTALSGWPLDDAYHVPGTGTMRGALTLVALAVVSLLAAASLRWTLARGTMLGRRAVVVSAAFLFVALVGTARWSTLHVGSSMSLRTVVRDLAVDASAWTVEQSDPAAPPFAGTLTPDVEFRLDVGEMPALLMPPPCRVSFTTPADGGPVRLRGAAGCDLEAALAADSAESAPRLHFRVEVDGRTVFEHVRVPWRGEEQPQRAWARFGGGDGLSLLPGARVTLSVDVEGAPGASTAPVAAGFGGLALVSTRKRARERATIEHPNVVLVVVDTLRADRTSAGGCERPTTPALERLAARGLVYENAFATSSWTWPSTASILTGLDPAEHGVQSDTACYLPEELVTLAEALQEQGWTTAGFSGNPLVSPDKNFAQGFETFDVAPSTFLTSDRIVPDALAWLESRASVRFFLYLHLIDPHEIHRVPAAELARFAGDPPADLDEHAMTHYAERLLGGEGRTPEGGFDPTLVVPPQHLAWLKDGYDAGVATADGWLERVLARLDELGLTDTTLIAFTSDHGEEFLDHGHMKHGQSLFGELVHVPLVLAGPRVPAGRRVREIVSNVDLAAAIARAAGVRFGPLGAPDLLDPDELAAREVFTATESGWWNGESDVALRGLRTGAWSLHYRRIAGDADPLRALDEGRVRLFDVARDPGELHDVAADERARVRPLVLEIERREALLSARRPKAVRAGRGTVRLLEATGYAGQGR